MSTNPETIQTCGQCGGEFTKRTMHWNKSSSCSYPSVSDRKHQLITGLLMGDGWIHTGSVGYPRLGVKGISREFIEWVNGELGFLSKWSTLKHTEDEVREFSSPRISDMTGYDASEYNYNDVYMMETITHPELEEYRNWYSSGEKVIPDNVDLSDLTAKIWYVCDGGIQWRGERANCYISTINESERIDYLASLFEQFSIYPTSNTSDRIYFPDGEVGKFLDWIGDPVPGYEYKWRVDDRSQYNEVKR